MRHHCEVLYDRHRHVGRNTSMAGLCWKNSGPFQQSSALWIWRRQFVNKVDETRQQNHRRDLYDRAVDHLWMLLIEQQRLVLGGGAIPVCASQWYRWKWAEQFVGQFLKSPGPSFGTRLEERRWLWAYWRELESRFFFFLIDPIDLAPGIYKDDAMLPENSGIGIDDGRKPYILEMKKPLISWQGRTM